MNFATAPSCPQPGGRPPASTLEYLQWHALMQPRKMAIRVESAGVDYERFYIDTLRVTQAVAREGVQPGQLVAVCTPDPYLHWLLLLACENLRAVSASFLRQEWQATQELLTHADWTFTDEAIDGLRGEQRVLNAEWIAQAMSLPVEQALQFQCVGAAQDEAVRLTRSSGSTGKPKLILQDRHRFEHSMRTLSQEIGFTAESVFLVTAPFVVNGVYLRASACLRLGATVVWGAAASALGSGQVTHVWFLPRVLNDVLQSLPSGWQRPPRLRLAVGGGPLPDVLRDRARAWLTDDLLSGYGANEVGSLAHLTAQGHLLLLPGVDLQIVDDQGLPVAAGEVGHVALRTPAMAKGYWRQPEQSARHFRSGWFFPGDLGRWVGPRRFVLLGREDDVLNLGGIKQSPLPVEDEFLRQPQVRDAAVTAVTGPQGVDLLLVVLVVEEGTDLAALGQRVASQLPSWASPMRVMACRQIPRTVAGKVDRPRLMALLESGVAF